MYRSVEAASRVEFPLSTGEVLVRILRHGGGRS